MTDNITLPRATVQQALDALEDRFNETNIEWGQKDRAITALKAALGYWDIGEDNPDSLSKHPAFRRAPQQQAEPVAWGMAEKDGLILDVICPEEHQSYEGEYTIPLYTTPPQRKPLTVKEINALPEANGYWPIGMNDRILRLIRAAEAAHGIKEGT